MSSWVCGVVFAISCAVIATCIFGCAAVEKRTVDLCAGLKPGAATVASVRPSESGVLGIDSLAWPWISPQALFAVRTEAGVCTVETESPSTSDLMSMVSSPISSALSHATVPVVP